MIYGGKDACNKTCNDQEIKSRAKEHLDKLIQEFKNSTKIYIEGREIEVNLVLLSDSSGTTEDQSDELVEIME